MNRSLSLLSAITLSSAALFSVQPQEASAMTIAFDCFERSTEKLVARSAVDMTSTVISCLPVPGSTASTGSVDQGDEYGDTLEAGNTSSDDQTDWEDEGEDDQIAWEDEGENDSEPDDTTASTPDWGDEEDNSDSGSESTGSQLGNIIGDLIGKGLDDLFRR